MVSRSANDSDKITHRVFTYVDAVIGSGRIFSVKEEKVSTLEGSVVCLLDERRETHFIFKREE